jgi:hypothetical protein
MALESPARARAVRARSGEDQACVRKDPVVFH